MLLLNVRRNFSSDQKVFKRLVLPEGDNWRFRIYLTESIALSLVYCFYCCLLACLCLEALKLALLVTDRILFSASSRLAWSGIMVANFCLRALMALVSVLTFFSC